MILLDTNFLLYLAKYRIAHAIDNLGEKLLLPKQVLKEITDISARSKGSLKQSAAIALALIEKWQQQGKLTIRTIEAKSADASLLKLAVLNKINKTENVAVATLDKKLIKRLKKASIDIMKIRQKKLVEKNESLA